MKLALLFLVIVIAFFGCNKPETPTIVQSEVHEINIATAGGNVTDRNENLGWQFYYFWHLDLANDSVYTKLNLSLLTEEQQSAEIESGTFPFLENKTIQAFIAEAANTKDHTYFRKPVNKTAVCGPNLLVIEYKQGRTSKIFFFEEGNKAFSELKDLLNSTPFKEALFPVYAPINVQDGKLVNKIKNSPFFDSLQLIIIPNAPRTIKIMPPVTKNAE